MFNGKEHILVERGSAYPGGGSTAYPAHPRQHTATNHAPTPVAGSPSDPSDMYSYPSAGFLAETRTSMCSRPGLTLRIVCTLKFIYCLSISYQAHGAPLLFARLLLRVSAPVAGLPVACVPAAAARREQQLGSQKPPTSARGQA